MALNLRDLLPGDQIRTLDGERLVVAENPGDGAWLIAHEVGAPDSARPVFVAELVPDDE